MCSILYVVYIYLAWKDKNMDENSDDRPPTPPQPLEGELKGRKRERGRRGMKEAKQSEGSDYVTDEDDHEVIS